MGVVKDVVKFFGPIIVGMALFMTGVFFVVNSDRQAGKAVGTVIDVFEGGFFHTDCTVRLRYGDSLNVVSVSTFKGACMELSGLTGKQVVVHYRTEPLIYTFREFTSRNLLTTMYEVK